MCLLVQNLKLKKHIKTFLWLYIKSWSTEWKINVISRVLSCLPPLLTSLRLGSESKIQIVVLPVIIGEREKRTLSLFKNTKYLQTQLSKNSWRLSDLCIALSSVFYLLYLISFTKGTHFRIKRFSSPFPTFRLLVTEHGKRQIHIIFYE